VSEAYTGSYFDQLIRELISMQLELYKFMEELRMAEAETWMTEMGIEPTQIEMEVKRQRRMLDMAREYYEDQLEELDVITEVIEQYLANLRGSATSDDEDDFLDPEQEDEDRED
jgi:hypothetical protein